MQTSGPQMLTFPEMTDSDENTIILLEATTNSPRRTRKNAGEERKKNFFLQFDFCLFASKCKKTKQKKKKKHRKRRVSVKRRKGTVHQKIESQSHLDGKSEEVSVQHRDAARPSVWKLWDPKLTDEWRRYLHQNQHLGWNEIGWFSAYPRNIQPFCHNVASTATRVADLRLYSSSLMTFSWKSMVIFCYGESK